MTIELRGERLRLVPGGALASASASTLRAALAGLAAAPAVLCFEPFDPSNAPGGGSGGGGAAACIGNDHVVAVNLTRPVPAHHPAVADEVVEAARLCAAEKHGAAAVATVGLDHFLGGPCDDDEVVCCIVPGGRGKGWTEVSANRFPALAGDGVGILAKAIKVRWPATLETTSSAAMLERRDAPAARLRPALLLSLPPTTNQPIHERTNQPSNHPTIHRPPTTIPTHLAGVSPGERRAGPGAGPIPLTGSHCAAVRPRRTARSQRRAGCAAALRGRGGALDRAPRGRRRQASQAGQPRAGIRAGRGRGRRCGWRRCSGGGGGVRGGAREAPTRGRFLGRCAMVPHAAARRGAHKRSRVRRQGSRARVGAMVWARTEGY